MKTSAIEEQAGKVEAEYDADLLIYFGPISRKWDDSIIDLCAARKNKKKNVLLMLTTLGGDAHAAYRIARCLHHNYRKSDNSSPEGQVLIYVSNVCSSAGTLIALAADKLILSNHAELGPLDVQVRKPDEVGERTSGLTPIQALHFLESESKKFFKAQFEGLRFARSLSFSTRMAADISAQLASGLLAKLYDQIDPLRLAEYDRLMRIAEQYGERIKTKNVKSHTIKHLLENYPSHEFCIDPTEAKELFNCVETPKGELELLGNRLKHFADKMIAEDDVAAFYLTQPAETEKEKAAKNEPQKSVIAHGRSATGSNGNGKSPAGKRQRRKAATAAPLP